MSVIASICARGGSKGCPGKNTRQLLGKPLIAYTIEQALACDFIDEVYVSTDDETIAMIAKRFGAKVPFIRPSELATDTAPKVPVIAHLYEYLNSADIECIIDLDPTSPLRNNADILNCLRLFRDEGYQLVITGYEAEKNPYFNMVEVDRNTDRVMLCKAFENQSNIVARQLAPKVYAMNASIYVWQPECLTSSIWDLHLGFYEMPRSRSIDIDDEIDFQLVKLIMERELYETNALAE